MFLSETYVLIFINLQLVDKLNKDGIIYEPNFKPSYKWK